MNEKGLISTNELAAFWGVDARTVQNYADVRFEEEPLPRDGRGLFNFVKAQKWMYNRLRKKIEVLETAGDEKMYAQKLLDIRVKRELNETKLKIMQQQLVEKQAVLMAWTNQINVIKNYINSLKYDLFRETADVTDELEKREIIERNINLALARITKVEIERYIATEDSIYELFEGSGEEE